jgi:hypothetical protein
MKPNDRSIDSGSFQRVAVDLRRLRSERSKDIEYAVTNMQIQAETRPTVVYSPYKDLNWLTIDITS